MKKAVILLAAATLVTLLGACGGDVSTDRGEETEQETLVESVESVESETETVSAEGEEESVESAAEAVSTESEEDTTGTEAEEETADTESTESGAAAESEADTEAAQTTVESAAAPAADAAAAAAANTAGSLLETAKSFEGASVDALIQAIGQPISSDYAPSCLGEGEDGNLYYDGFTVYTYRDATGEVVSYVE